jgi:glycolate oxidase iron-sulfur subunit
VSCGLCLNDCPTYRVLGDEADSPRGRIQLIRALIAAPHPPGETLAPPDPSAVAHLDACLVCRACETVCPSLVPFGRIMEGAREEIAERTDRGGPIARAVRAALIDVVTRPWLLSIATTLATLYERSGVRALARRILPRRLRDMESLVAAREGPAYRPIEREGSDTQLFAGCVMRAGFGETQRATVRALERSGRRVGAPTDQACCGALHAHAGLGGRARELARRNVRAFAGTEGPVVVTAAGCGAHLKAYGHLLRSDPDVGPEEVDRFAARVRDATEIVTPVDTSRGLERPLRVVYQDACHLAHGQGIRRQPRDLLRAMRGVEIVPIADPERCCGSAGVYNLTHPEVAQELQRQKVRAILAARPDAVVSANPGCILQIRAGLREAESDVPVVHLMRFIDDPAGPLALDA